MEDFTKFLWCFGTLAYIGRWTYYNFFDHPAPITEPQPVPQERADSPLGGSGGLRQPEITDYAQLRELKEKQQPQILQPRRKKLENG